MQWRIWDLIAHQKFEGNMPAAIKKQFNKKTEFEDII